MSAGLKELCLCDNEGERKSRRDKEGAGPYVFWMSDFKAESLKDHVLSQRSKNVQQIVAHFQIVEIWLVLYLALSQ